MATLTLAEFADSYEFFPCRGVVGDDCVAFPDSSDSELRRGFWSLADYAVSSVTGGSVWLVKRGSKVR